MSDTKQKLEDGNNKKTTSKTVGKIEPLKKSSGEVLEAQNLEEKKTDNAANNPDEDFQNEKGLLGITRLFLREYGIRKSGGCNTQCS